MSRTWLAVLALLAVLGSTPLALADKDKDKHHGKPDKVTDRARHDRDDDDRWEHRNGYEYRVYERDRRPPGWSRGKKTGWGNCDLPPGQAKKYGCHSYTYRGRRHYWYQDDQGRIVVRRPSIHVE